MYYINSTLLTQLTLSGKLSTGSSTHTSDDGGEQVEKMQLYFSETGTWSDWRNQEYKF